MTTLFCWFGANTLAKPIFFPAPRVALPRIHFWLVLPRFVRMKMALVPRGAAFGFTVMALSVIVTLIVMMAGEFVVPGRAKPGAAITSGVSNAMPTSLPLLIAGTL